MFDLNTVLLLKIHENYMYACSAYYIFLLVFYDQQGYSEKPENYHLSN